MQQSLARMRYAKPVNLAVQYLAQRVLNDAWVREHDDVAYYFKAPMAFLEAGDRIKAEQALRVAERYLEKGGLGSKNEAYNSMFPHYPWVWLCYAAAGLGEEWMHIAQSCHAKLGQYTIPASGTGLVIAPYKGEGEPYEADIFATAEVLKVAMLIGHHEVATASADTIVKTLAANKAYMQDGRFYLRWNGERDGRLTLLAKDEVKDEVFYCINQEAPGQLYFLLAFPAMTLLERASDSAREIGQEKAAEYKAVAMEFLGFLKGCTGIYESPWAHKFARAAAMVGDAETARKIADFFVSTQHDAGCFQSDLDAMDNLDQTAELVVWLQQIDKDVAKS